MPAMADGIELNAPLSSEDLARLHEFLLSGACNDDAMSVDQVHGLLTAIVCGPEPVLPSEWIPAVFGEEPEFASVEEDEQIMALLMRMNNEIVNCLDDPADTPDFEPILAMPEQATTR